MNFLVIHCFVQISALTFNQLAAFGNVSSRKWKYDESYMQFGFTSIILSGEEKPQCVFVVKYSPTT